MKEGERWDKERRERMGGRARRRVRVRAKVGCNGLSLRGKSDRGGEE